MKRLIASLLTLCLIVSMAAWALNATGALATAEGVAADTASEASAPAAGTDSGSSSSSDSSSGSSTDSSAKSTSDATAAIADTTDTGTTDTGTTDTGSTQSDAAQAEATATATATTENGTGETATTDPTATLDPTATPDPAATLEPEATLDPAAAEQEPYLAPTVETPVAEEDVGSGPAWVAEGAHRRYGDLDDLLPIAMVSGVTIVLCSTQVFEITGYSLGDLSALSFGVDKEALGEYADGRRVIISAISPSGAMDNGTTYIWVGLPGNVPTAAEGLDTQLDVTDEGALLETEIMVEASGYTDGEACMPTFTLHAYPELADGMAFALIENGGEAQAIGGSSWAPSASGDYQFAVLDATGAVVARSVTYTVVWGEAAAADPAAEDATAETEADGTLTQADVVAEVSLTEAMGEPEALEIIVRAYDYLEGATSSVAPSFSLSGVPAEGSYSYGISINGKAINQLKGERFAETDSGDFTYVFYILDTDGAAVASSGQYHVVLDFSTAAETGDAWMASGNSKIYGSLSSLLRQADSGATIYLLTTNVLSVSGSSALSGVHLAPDPDRYGSEYGVVISQTNPAGEYSEGVTYVWLGIDVDEMAFTRDVAYADPTFTVDAVTIGSRTLSGGMWVNGNAAVHFTITDSVAGNTYQYEISTDGGVLFSSFSDGGTLHGLTTGSNYDLVFRVTAVGDETNTVTTSVISVNYDNAAPTLIVKAGDNGTVTFYAGDTDSGFGSAKNVTFNATASPIRWVARLSAQGARVYTYSVQYDRDGYIAAGTLGVRDAAGNIAVWNTEITITVQGGRGGGGGGMASSGRGGGRSVYHSASTYDSVTIYGGVDLVVETGEMNTLTIGETQLPLNLTVDGHADTDAPFTASLLTWNGQSTDTEETQTDTLVLTSADSTAADGTYVWSFSGSVYKQLSASGINYMVFKVGQQAVALSTAGFAAGVRYNLYRMAGLASKAFDYAVTMDAQGGFSLSVTVEGQTYALTADQQSEFYYYNVLSGTVDMLTRPFGQADGQSNAA